MEDGITFVDFWSQSPGAGLDLPGLSTPRLDCHRMSLVSQLELAPAVVPALGCVCWAQPSFFSNTPFLLLPLPSRPESAFSLSWFKIVSAFVVSSLPASTRVSL